MSDIVSYSLSTEWKNTYTKPRHVVLTVSGRAVREGVHLHIVMSLLDIVQYSQTESERLLNLRRAIVRFCVHSSLTAELKSWPTQTPPAAAGATTPLRRLRSSPCHGEWVAQLLFCFFSYSMMS